MYYLLISLFFSLPILGEVLTSPTIETVIERAESPFWLVIDLDNTLFEGKEALGHADWFADLLKAEMEKGLSKPDALSAVYPLWIETQKINHVQPVEERFIEWVKELQEKGTPVVALTARSPEIQSSTERQLRDLGVDLRLSALNGALKESFSYETTYQRGILYANDLNDKGVVFKTFLKENGLKPSRIVFVDDKLENVENFNNAFKDTGIEITALHYTALEQKEPVYHPAVAKFQYEKLHALLNNDEALLLLHHQPDIHQ